jgi:ATP diphosphatase
MAAIDELLRIMTRLRDPDGGCPWDLEQDFASLAPYAIEEAYEVQDAIAKGDMDHFKEELGDLLLQVVFQCEMARQLGLFTFDDVAKGISDKMVSRHPHVFGDASAETADKVLAQWDDIKLREKADKPASHSILDDVPVNLPAVTRAQKLQKKAAKVGFDWATPAQVFDKIEEEIIELKQAIEKSSSSEIEEEFGDLLFAFVNLGRKLGLDCETALTKCNQKFYRRFSGIEQQLKSSSKEFKDCTLDELEEIWVQQKIKEKAA